MFKPLLMALAILFTLRPALADDDIAKKTIAFRGHDRTYYLYAPPAGPAPAPMIVLFHGTGGIGLYMAQMWKDVAAREGIVLVAPDAMHSEAGWDLKVDGPDFIRAILAEVAAAHPIDPHRMYLFGQSGGAVYSLRLGMLESEFFAAVAIHAGSWRHPEDYRMTGYATRKIPVSISIGDKDEYFSMESVENTRRVLADRGFPIAVNILKGRVHRYSDTPADFNAGIWTFLRSHVLPSDPKFADYYYQAPLR
jgi:poly(3-hydroxybutyrate) depolymerase